MENSKLNFVLVGFSESTGFRVFEFEGIASDRTRAVYTVRTDLALARRYGIRLQELPLLCREVLERRGEGEIGPAFTYSESAMSDYAGVMAARDAASKRKPQKRPISDRVGSAWRGPNPQSESTKEI